MVKYTRKTVPPPTNFYRILPNVTSILLKIRFRFGGGSTAAVWIQPVQPVSGCFYIITFKGGKKLMKRRILSTLMALVLCLTLLPAAAYAAGGTAVYVSSSGNDGTGDGSADKPYATLAKAVEAAEDGATVYVMSDLTMTAPPVSGLLQSRKKLSF